MDARATIGEPQPDDWELVPARHAGHLPAEAAPLRRILESEAALAHVALFEQADRKAIHHQREYKNRSKRAAICLALAGIVDSFVLYFSLAAEKTPWLASSALRLPILGVAAVLAAWAAREQGVLARGGLFGGWMSERGLAEGERVAFFETVCGPRSEDAREADDPELVALQLEYFRRYQLDVQIDYYRARGRRHEESSRHLISRGGWIGFGVTLVAGAASIAGGLADWVATLALVGIATPILVVLQANLGLLNLDQSNALRYRSMYETLVRLKGRLLDAARGAAAEGRRHELDGFVSAVHTELSLEHRIWRGVFETRPEL